MYIRTRGSNSAHLLCSAPVLYDSGMCSKRTSEESNNNHGSKLREFSPCKSPSLAVTGIRTKGLGSAMRVKPDLW
ncbi:hypothetical protein Mp_7g11350 [Marchantia polymorpha subsp. ruderalis]|uniref:Uncharacterized protein n=2 Tax=Marchantia polymorpha TaxID=3197 RepID=A0AAF6BYD9_MARPO|nr:hypothetical protein MARPO_0003s0149 [Marchantia polymorpha]BBN17023.1 hypothetical protein Mp_7g11350 [Marchantia polymorpha subsp. ruderalis]|eukprot:PTQ49261.1 hypothetical protein MARPO_0003s0149 [Marchantia polymorpha]